MKRIMLVLVTICILLLDGPIFVYASNYIPSISCDTFSNELIELDKKYNDEPVGNRLIVKSKHKINVLDSVDVIEGYEDLHIVQFDNSDSAEKALAYYSKNKQIEYAECDSTVQITEEETEEDEESAKEHITWGAEYVDYDGYISTIENFPEIVVGVIDTGIDYNHEFLSERTIRTNFNSSDSGNENDELDDNGHGSHVSSTIVDCTSDNIKLADYKCLNKNGSGDLTGIISAIYAAIDDNVNVINMSFGAYSPNSNFFKDVVETAVEKDVTVCVAAGNSGKDAIEFTPASEEKCITVAAINSKGDFPYWTNYGDVVDILAPGVDIYGCWKNGGYKTASGTSMASPHVAAAAALVKTKHPEWTPKNIRDFLVFNGNKANGIGLGNKQVDSLNTKAVLRLGEFYDEHNTRPPSPVFSKTSGRYDDGLTVELCCEDNDAEIFYNIFEYGDYSEFDFATATKYTEPISVTKSSRIVAKSYYRERIPSNSSTAIYFVSDYDTEEFDIDDNGMITAYYGNSSYIVIPKRIRGVLVKGIGEGVFGEEELKTSKLVEISVPQSMECIGKEAFKNCDHLKAFYGGNIKTVDKKAFYYCLNLANFNISTVESIDEYSFAFTRLQLIDNSKLTEIPSFAFTDVYPAQTVNLPNVKVIQEEGLGMCNDIIQLNLPKVETLYGGALYCLGVVESIDLPSLKYLYDDNVFGLCHELKYVNLKSLENKIPRECFAACSNLEYVYCPKVKLIEENAFDAHSDIRFIFTPKAETIYSLPQQNIDIYCSDKLKYMNRSTYDVIDESVKYRIIAPAGSYAEQWANENNAIFVNSESMAKAKGGSIRPIDNGLRFGFSWDEIHELVEIADNIEYGFEYAYGETDELNKTKKANNYVYHPDDNNTTFNLVFTGVPKSSFDVIISARAYVNIDGMIFKSPILYRSFSGVANAALNDNTLDEGIKEQIRQALEA